MSTPKDIFYTFSDICGRLKMEPAKARYYDIVFTDILRGSDPSSALNRFYTEEQFQNFKLISDLIDNGGHDIASARKILFERNRAAKKLKPAARAHITCLCSGKGGVGKTFITVNCAAALSGLGKKVLIVDGDMGLANVHILCDVKQNTHLKKAFSEQSSLSEGIVEGPAGVHIAAGLSGDKDLANLSKAGISLLIEQIQECAAGYDHVLIDAGAGISRMVIELVVQSDSAVVVTTPVISAIADAYGLIKTVVQEKPGAKMDLLINAAKSHQEAEHVRSKIGECCRNFLGRDIGFLGCVLKSSMVDQSIQNRSPLMISFPYSKTARCINIIAQELIKQTML